jgi:hypothetical protein
MHAFVKPILHDLAVMTARVEALEEKCLPLTAEREPAIEAQALAHHQAMYKRFGASIEAAVDEIERSA